MESMATLDIPACGYGIRYDHGLFRQVIRDGWQQEYPEEWLSFGNPWEFARPELIYDVHFGGRVEQRSDLRALPARSGIPRRPSKQWPMIRRSWGGRPARKCVRLWSARAVDPMRLDVFNQGEHVAALSEQARAETISKILYPSDDTPAGQELRLRQEYFFVSASLQDIVHRHLCADGGHPFPAGTRCGSTQRHTSEHRRPRADANPHRSARTPVGRGLADLRRNLVLHQPHALAGSARELAVASPRAHVAEAFADYLRINEHHLRSCTREKSSTPTTCWLPPYR